MAEEMLKGFLTDSAKSVLGMVTSLIEQEIKLVWGFKDDLKNLQVKLQTLIDMVSQADSSYDETNNLVFKGWMKKVKLLLYDAEDVLEEIAYALLERKIASKMKKSSSNTINGVRHRKIDRVRNRIGMMFSCSRSSLSSNPLVFRFRMAHKVKSLKDAIVEVYADAKELGIKPVKVTAGGYGSSSSSSNVDQKLHFYRENPETKGMVGRENNIVELIDLLRQASEDKNNDLNVIGIQGMAGLGKTTLAKRLLESTEVKEKFKEQIVICVSHDFDRMKLLNTMVEQIYRENKNLSDVKTITNVLQEKLKDKKYLLVLDDVWDTFATQWSSFRCVLEDVGGTKGSTILVTSRSEKTLGKLELIGSKAGSMVSPRIYSLTKLEEKFTWDLFKQILGGELLDHEIAETLIKKCDGVPLAIRTLAGLLRMRKSIEEWREIEKSKIWDQEEDDTILASVKLSYKYLPSVWLKKCFAYCAIFKEDELIEKARLIQLWMAQGFLQSVEEATGERYFNHLQGISFFQDQVFDNLGNVVYCKMHDVVYKLAQTISGKEVLLCSSSSTMLYSEASEVRHLQCFFTSSDEVPLEIGENKMRTLTLVDPYPPYFNDNIGIIDGYKVIEKNIIKSRWLRSLSLISLGLSELPDSIGELKHLRFLDVSGNTFPNFPNGLSKLHNLQTLRAGGDHFVTHYPKLPYKCHELINLRHMCTDYYTRDGCDMGVSENLGLISDLQTIPQINLISDWGGKISELGKLSKLKGRLSIKHVEKASVEDLMKVNLASKFNIQELRLQWDDDEDETNVMMMKEQLSALQPHPNLLSLTIKYYWCTDEPTWFREMNSLANLVHLIILRCKFTQLSSLNNLVSLKTLRIMNCYNLTFVSSLKGLDKLENLAIHGCDLIKHLPSLEGLVSLKYLDIARMINLQSMPPLPDYLEYIYIGWCHKMTRLPVGMLNYLLKLKSMYLGPFSPEVVRNFPFPILNPGSHALSRTLSSLNLDAMGMEKVRRIPNQIQQFTALTSLYISYFSNLENLPEWLGNLHCLRNLELVHLPRLKSLPKQDVLRRLEKLEISGCPQFSGVYDLEDAIQWWNRPEPLMEELQLSQRERTVRNEDVGSGSNASRRSPSMSSYSPITYMNQNWDYFFGEC